MIIFVIHYFSWLSKNTIDITEDAAREHENWFVKFEELKNKQKEAIMKWKKEKKNVFVLDCNSNNCDMLRKCADNDPGRTEKVRSVQN